MAKLIVIRKHKDMIEIRDAQGNLIADILVAKSSRSSSVNLSIKADETVSINKVSQTLRPKVAG